MTLSKPAIALLMSEWAGGSCPSCLALEGTTHQPRCAHDESLTEAGYPARVERQEMRNLISRSVRCTIPPGEPQDEPITR